MTFAGQVFFIAAAVAVVLIALAVWIYKRRDALWPARSNYHGITVGAAKVYDSRSLSLMLEQLREQLRTLQTLDSKKISDGIGGQQAQVKKETSITAGAGKTDDNSDAKKADSSSSSGDASKDPSSPALSERALDLLADQVNLSYDIFNLRLMLERAISDRIMEDAEKDGKKNTASRVQAVVGFPISIDPPEFSAGCAAIVEVELSTTDVPLSLVALFPQEESRNASIMSSSRVSLAGTANASGVPLNAGYQQSRSTNAFRRESDTVALERPAPRKSTQAAPPPAGTSDEHKVVFAWEFRPTSACPSPAPGTRQMLAVISLKQPDVEGATDFVEVAVRVRSYWRRFDVATQTLSNSSGWRVLCTKGDTEADWQEQLPKVRAPLSHAVDKGLAPTFQDIQWHQVGDQKAVVIVTGKNFFSGTSVVIGNETLDRPENGLVIKSEKSLQITVPLSALTHEAVLNARYGPSLELKMTPPAQLAPFEITDADFTQLSTGQIYVNFTLESTSRHPPDASNLEGARRRLDIDLVKKLPSPLLELNGRFATATLQIFLWPRNDPKVHLCAHVEKDFVLIGSGTSVRLTFPFLGMDWSLLFRTNDIRGAASATRLVDGEWTTIWFTGGRYDWGTWSVLLDRIYEKSGEGFNLISSDLLELKVPTKIADKYDQAFLIGYYGTKSVAIPRDQPRQPAPSPGAATSLDEIAPV